MYCVEFCLPGSFGKRMFADLERAISATSEMIRDKALSVTITNQAGATIFSYRR